MDAFRQRKSHRLLAKLAKEPAVVLSIEARGLSLAEEELHAAKRHAGESASLNAPEASNAVSPTTLENTRSVVLLGHSIVPGAWLSSFVQL